MEKNKFKEIDKVLSPNYGKKVIALTGVYVLIVVVVIIRLFSDEGSVLELFGLVVIPVVISVIAYSEKRSLEKAKAFFEKGITEDAKFVFEEVESSGGYRVWKDCGNKKQQAERVFLMKEKFTKLSQIVAISEYEEGSDIN